MDGHAHGMAGGLAGLSEAVDTALQAAPAWERYAHFSRPLARAVLLILAIVIILAAWAPGMPAGPAEVPNAAPAVSDPALPRPTVSGQDNKDNDLRFYRLVIERVKRGDNYYAAATELQRVNHYPVAPGFTVRLPTLAYAMAWLGPVGTALAFYSLLAAVLLTMWRRLGEEPGGEPVRMVALALMFVGLSTAIHLNFAVLHEVWAAEFMALSFALHRPAKGKWLGAVLAGAAALAVRELALPFVLLMTASALRRRARVEALAWGLVLALFAAGLAIHLHLAEAQIRPGDPVSPPWLVFGGLNGLLYKVINSSSLSLLPTVVAGPVVVLALFGWTGWKSAAGDFGALLLLGYGLAFMIAGRDNNFYWGVLITPLLFIGLAFAPRGLKALWRSAGRSGAHG